jgi:hypothetical protein
MGRVVQRVDPVDLAGVLAPHARAAIAFERDGVVEAFPVLYCRRGDEHCVGVARDAMPEPESFARAVLVLDDGSYWFELRAVTWRGRLDPAPAEAAGARDDLVWLAFVPIGAIAWDYGRLHEEPDA